MKKIVYLIYAIIFLNFIAGCAGYKPLYTTNLQFEIADYSLKSDEQLGKKIYSKLYNLSKRSKKENNQNIKKIIITIDATKTKNATAKDRAGNILEYKIILSSNIIIKDFFTKIKY